MPEYFEVLTGPQAAAMLGLDGFRERNWPLEFSCRHGRHDVPYIQSRRWREPFIVDGIPVAHPTLVLRHLGYFVRDTVDGIRPDERIELALEHARRLRLVTLDDLHTRGGANPGDAALRPILKRRRGEPCTESYPETRTLQAFRSWGLQTFTQVPVYDVPEGWQTGTELPRLRSDFAVMYRPVPRRPAFVKPHDAVRVELHSIEHHGATFVSGLRRRETTQTPE
jgi:hypothetical protein